ncbi:hypothetical protein MSG28_005063 [Choristoneura fumiferana]|uniref:Uncharacterized protein n=1 Tax=Choristoneura fumiferana TaxID=7141 RepID=A0ACC0JPV7_CHOFU|nr:hypothetical protein MSG28_005063 [Choristoneura fumiferana]
MFLIALRKRIPTPPILFYTIQFRKCHSVFGIKELIHQEKDPNTKDFLYFTAKLQETPNLWKTYNVPKIFEIKMLAVIPELRRLGLATMLAEKSKELARDQGYNVVRMDCINPYE